MWLFAGPCVIENDKIPFVVAEKIKNIADELGYHFIFES